MYHGDRARKQMLVDYGFRLPSAFDNRPLSFEEAFSRFNQIIYVSATPSDYEQSRSTQVVEQVIRPTGLLDPKVYVRPVEGQIDDLITEIAKNKEKVREYRERARKLVSQMTLEEKTRRANVVIDNRGQLDRLYAQLSSQYQALVRKVSRLDREEDE